LVSSLLRFVGVRVHRPVAPENVPPAPAMRHASHDPRARRAPQASPSAVDRAVAREVFRARSLPAISEASELQLSDTSQNGRDAALRSIAIRGVSRGEDPVQRPLLRGRLAVLTRSGFDVTDALFAQSSLDQLRDWPNLSRKLAQVCAFFPRLRPDASVVLRKTAKLQLRSYFMSKYKQRLTCLLNEGGVATSYSSVGYFNVVMRPVVRTADIENTFQRNFFRVTTRLSYSIPLPAGEESVQSRLCLGILSHIISPVLLLGRSSEDAQSWFRSLLRSGNSAALCHTVEVSINGDARRRIPGRIPVLSNEGRTFLEELFRFRRESLGRI